MKKYMKFTPFLLMFFSIGFTGSIMATDTEASSESALEEKQTTTTIVRGQAIDYDGCGWGLDECGNPFVYYISGEQAGLIEGDYYELELGATDGCGRVVLSVTGIGSFCR
ncbi:hypothetical protein AB9P05_11870 [Roseivirga sp. BDSF3-8]|uniref:hypothetical protein n=1 Tax=Roseivirga sp. BDSF3-8 TaxID=3241598 RepID=UPI003531E81C